MTAHHAPDRVVLVAVAALVAATAVAPGVGFAGVADGSASGDSATRLLVVEHAETGEPLARLPVENGTFVGLRYTHSVEKTPVLDGYRVRGDRLEMTTMVFESYGAGLPARADVTRTADGAFVFDPGGVYEELYVSPGRVAGHQLVVGDLRFDLVALSDGATVRLHLVTDGGTGDGRGDSTANRHDCTG